MERREIFMELKKSNGFDVIDDAVSYQAFYGQCQEILRSLSRGATLLRAYSRLAVEAEPICICMNRRD